jgi:GNAT superfamily N-acetyltransferase
LLADQVTEIPEGWVIRSRSLSQVWMLNQVRIASPVDFELALALAERHLGDLQYRQLTIEDPAGGAALEDRFRAGGWRVDCQVTMALTRGPDRVVDTATVVEPAGEEVSELLKRWRSETDVQAPSAEEQRQLERYWRLEWQVRKARRLGIRGRDGTLAAITLLYSDEATAQVEDVYTVPEERGRGFARALISRALELAAEHDPELTFIVADDRGWPKQLYARLGFEPVGRTWGFHRDG